ncbi:MAG: cellulase family glycosylhydrolase, partial [Candidatus Hydrogenedentes bacterium]|nr:cellulase family glycosylhydrolase [Candidatus Hydrogenedentota bacterium]
MTWIAALTVCVAAAGGADAELTAPALFPESGAFGVVVHTPFRAGGLKAVGAQWVRVNVRWGNVEQGARGAYAWDGTDKLLRYYLDEGFRVMAVLTAENLCPLYEDDKDNKPVVIDAIATWAGAAAARYRGQGILWELGNEPECFPMGGYWTDPKTYADMARKAAAAIKAADPEARVAALSVAWMDRGFISTCLEEGLLADGHIDALSYHGYHRRGMTPESGLADDVGWLRGQIAKYAPAGKSVIVVDSERGYAMVDFLEPKHWGSWRNLTYSESEQAAYCARHYLETISLGVEVAVWYKDMVGEHCYSLYYGTDDDEAGLRPMGHVYRNLAALLPDNPKRLVNCRYTVSLTDPPDDVSAPDGQLNVRT